MFEKRFGNTLTLPKKDRTTFNSSRSLRKFFEVKEKSLWKISFDISFLESRNHKFGIRFERNFPRNDFTRKQVDDNAKISPFLPDPDVSDVADPNLIGRRLFKFTLQKVFIITAFSFGRMIWRFF